MTSEEEDNPLLRDFIFPPYDVVEPKHVGPAIRSLLKKLESDLVELEATVEPSWPKLVEPLERIIEQLTVVWGIVDHLNAVKDSPELRSAIEDVQSQKVEFQLRLGQSKPIYNAFKTIRESSDWETLSDARKRVVEGIAVCAGRIKEAVLNGVSLEGESRDRFNKIQQELEKLSQKFEENILDATKKYEKLVRDKKEIEGLPGTTLAMAAEVAVSKGYEKATAEDGPWILTLDGPSYRSALQHARNRSLREEMYRAYITRASDGDLNNTRNIERILELRLEKAKILGYKNYAEVSMEMKMATLEKAKELIEKLRSASWNAAVIDMQELKDFAKSQGAIEAGELTHWDINFWSERLRELRYNINEIWNKDVRFFCVKNCFGAPISYFYFDPYSRPSEKRGGAWAGVVVGRSHTVSGGDTSPRLPIAQVVCNQNPPVGSKPSLMTMRKVEAVFHKFGHALQHMLTKQDEGLVSGYRGIEWDAIELPSQFMENWCYQSWEFLGLELKIVQTSGCNFHIPVGSFAVERVLKVFAFNSQLRYAIVDLELHTKYIPGGPESIYDIDGRVGKMTHVIPLLQQDRFLCSFSHIFADQYATGYYSYQWAEVLSFDAFSAFEEVGLDNDQAVKELGQKFWETVLAIGGGKAPLEVFVEFRGRNPSPNAFLRYNGLLPAVVAS